MVSFMFTCYFKLLNVHTGDITTREFLMFCLVGGRMCGAILRGSKVERVGTQFNFKLHFIGYNGQCQL